MTIRTSYAQGHPPTIDRDGYHVIRRAGRYMVFPRAALSEATGRHGARDGLVEIWNGVPFLSPLWARGPRVVFLHHVHGEMWRMVLPPNLARLGELLEHRLAPPLYRRSPILTLAESSRTELIEELGFKPRRVSVVPPGIDSKFSPGGERAPDPLVVAVGRLMPPKRFDELIRVANRVRAHHPPLRLVIVGDGYERHALEAVVNELGADDWVSLPGRVDEDELISLYRQAWAVASVSVREGWGMTLTEAAACGTPAVATDIAGHADAVLHDRSGLLGRTLDDVASQLDRILADAQLRRRLGQGALQHAATLTWQATALGTLSTLADDAHRRRGRNRHTSR